jgi:hypothetical protein
LRPTRLSFSPLSTSSTKYRNDQSTPIQPSSPSSKKISFRSGTQLDGSRNHIVVPEEGVLEVPFPALMGSFFPSNEIDEKFSAVFQVDDIDKFAA